MLKPRVSFIIPCYKLAHLLSECVGSILSQTHQDFEVLIMDDCSPDNTPEVARSFQDPRVKHIRNEQNLGHLANYNKGISLAQGEYIWLISADDSLRSTQVLQRFVRMIDHAPNIGYVFCPTMKVVNGQELGVMPYSQIAAHDMIISGHRFLTDHLVIANIVPAPAVMARKKCYEEVSYFPLDLPYAGDWYLWAIFALYFDVGFFAEPMVNRRFHKANMSVGFYNEAATAMLADNLAVPVRLYERVKKEGFRDLADSCRRGIIAEFLRQVTPPKADDAGPISLTAEEFDKSLRGLSYAQKEEADIRARVYAGLADVYYDRGDFSQAHACYRHAFQHDSQPLNVRAKYILLQMGSIGSIVRESISRLKRQAKRIPAGKLAARCTPPQVKKHRFEGESGTR